MFSCAVIGQHPLRFPWGFDEEDDGCRRMKLEMAQRIIKQSGVVLAVYAPDLADGSAEDKAVVLCACTGQSGHADSSRNSENKMAECAH